MLTTLESAPSGSVGRWVSYKIPSFAPFFLPQWQVLLRLSYSIL
jgi:hypothetical protein